MSPECYRKISRILSQKNLPIDFGDSDKYFAREEVIPFQVRICCQNSFVTLRTAVMVLCENIHIMMPTGYKIMLLPAS